jgi:protoporphyrinogen oxidase
MEILRRKIMISEKNILLGYFGLNSYDEIMTYIRDNPENEKVKEIKELFEIYSTDLDWEVDRDEK